MVQQSTPTSDGDDVTAIDIEAAVSQLIREVETFMSVLRERTTSKSQARAQEPSNDRFAQWDRNTTRFRTVLSNLEERLQRGSANSGREFLQGRDSLPCSISNLKSRVSQMEARVEQLRSRSAGVQDREPTQANNSASSRNSGGPSGSATWTNYTAEDVQNFESDDSDSDDTDGGSNGGLGGPPEDGPPDGRDPDDNELRLFLGTILPQWAVALVLLMLFNLSLGQFLRPRRIDTDPSSKGKRGKDI
ncbi:hypothetical protein PVAG01_02336 [Phlyctema vagabunda]|uniref:Syntaxin 6 N-terminal domain-containing protein n=1 Tax=Phlyctema vagabunda TaxID=108571 RepID=A0ABR4PQ85_9HELO